MSATIRTAFLIGSCLVVLPLCTACDGTGEADPTTLSQEPSAATPVDTPAATTGGFPVVTLPDDWPADVLLADTVKCIGVTRARNEFMANFHAPGQSLGDVVEWFETSMTENGWTADPPSIARTSAILPYRKADRTCGITITDFVLTRSSERDRSISGITILTQVAP